MLDSASYALVALLVILDPPGTAALFATMPPRDPSARRRRQALRAVAVASVALLGFALRGAWLLRAMGIALAAMKAAGGLLAALAAQIALEGVRESLG